MGKSRKRDPEDRDEFMHRVRATKTYVDTRNDPGIELAGFMAMFHPAEKTREMVQDVRDRHRRHR